MFGRPTEGSVSSELGERGATRVTFGPGRQRPATAALKEIATDLTPRGAGS